MLLSFFTHIIDAVLGQPMEGLEEEQHRKQGNELGVKVVPEHGKGQAGLGQRVPEALHKMLKLGGPQRSQEDLLH